MDRTAPRVIALILSVCTILLWWHWISALLWERGADHLAGLCLSSMVPTAAAFCPPAILLGGHFLSRNRRRGRLFEALILAPCFVGLLTLLVCWFAFDMQTGWAPCVTNPKRYAEVLPLSRPGFGHFPKVMPSSVSEATFVRSHILQGSIYYQLRVKLPEAEVAAIVAKFRKQALGVWASPLERDLDVPPSFVQVCDSVWGWRWFIRPFPDHYLILNLDPCLRGTAEERPRTSPEPNASYGWGPCTSCGLAVDAGASEVIYWAEDQ